jgi:hypothetical protein
MKTDCFDPPHTEFIGSRRGGYTVDNRAVSSTGWTSETSGACWRSVGVSGRL